MAGNPHRWWVLLAILLLPGIDVPAAEGAIYKCTKNGAVAYQSMPCPAGSDAVEVSRSRNDGLAGCYEVAFAPGDSGQPSTEWFQVAKTGAGLELRPRKRDLNGVERVLPGMPLKAATDLELRELSAAFGLELFEGVSAAGDGPNYKPVGLYRGRTQDGEILYFAYFFFANGRALRIPCPR
jgi:hypothetical protein